ncbi:branched-chain amino acid transport system substrate-binding protein [Roseateles asaccharophilus]|uniref:ABC transporter substrate-binding protein n=1 Tax=Roseateles asaccharophilus TaxID=582607 RepID=UPI0038388F44
MLRRRSILAGAALGLGALPIARATALSSARAKTPYAGSVIYIGQSAVQSGPSSLLGQEMTVGMNACFSAINKRGGINGRRIELVPMDDGYEPDTCKANTSKLIERGVFALGGYVGTPTCLAAFPAIAEVGIPFVGAFTGAETLRKFQPNIFHTRASYNQECEALVTQLLTLGPASRIGLFVQDDGYGAAVEAGITKALLTHGKKPEVVAKIKRNSMDDRAIAAAANMMKQAGINSYGLGSVYAACGKFKDAMGAIGDGGMWCSVSFIGTSGLEKNLGVRGKGIGITQVVPFPYLAPNSMMAGFHRDMAAVGADLSYGAMEGYINALTIVRGIQQCGDQLTWQRFVDALEHRIDLGGYSLDFSPSNREGSKFVGLSVINKSGRVQL